MFSTNKNRKILIFGMLFFAIPVFAEPASVEVVQNDQQAFATPNYNGQLAERSYLLGDVGGNRQSLANQGVTLDANLTQVEQGVASGGINKKWKYMGRGEVTLNLDTSKMGLWPGGLLTVMGEGNYGESLVKHTGSLLGVNINDSLPEPDNSFVLPQVSYTQFFSPQFGIVIGKLATINQNGGDMNEFAHGKGNDQFLSLPFNINPTTALTVPYSTLGMNAVYFPTKDLTLVAGFIDPNGDPASSGLDSLFEDGATFSLEARNSHKLFDKSGHILIGSTYSSSEYIDLDQRVANFIIPQLPVQQHQDSWSVYWNADQYVYEPEAGRGVGVFARFGASDGEANPIENFASFGIGGKGIIPCRDNDSFGLGYFYIWTADNRVTSTLDFGDSEGVEAYYQIQLTPAIQLSPDIQWVQPSQDRVENSWVLGLRLHTRI